MKNTTDLLYTKTITDYRYDAYVKRIRTTFTSDGKCKIRIYANDKMMTYKEIETLCPLINKETDIQLFLAEITETQQIGRKMPQL